ncbi:hypothetical protein LCGC14_1625380 [marine sediment metagenome]|uniref:Uncharacterized protein n=1 Tax=marine sediment metagenome TaxID=412755 RepID=A0A0F9L3W8_9ZZZZ
MGLENSPPTSACAGVGASGILDTRARRIRRGMMPVTLWSEVVGHECVQCGGPATHIYGYAYLCCDCHAGKDLGIVTRLQAQVMHDYYEEHGTVDVPWFGIVAWGLETGRLSPIDVGVLEVGRESWPEA